MFKSVLIANRGEIAVPHHAHLPASWASAPSPSTPRPTATRSTCALADEAYCIGPPPAARELPGHRRASSQRRAQRRRGDPPRLRLPLRERRFRRGLRGRRARLHRPAARGDAPDGRQDRRQARRRAPPACPPCPATPASGRTRARCGARPRASAIRCMIKAAARRRRQGHARGPTPERSFAEALAAAQREALAAFGDGTRLPRKARRRPAPRRVPDPRRPPRQCGPPGRARLLDPAPPPEGRRGEPLRRPDTRRCAPRWARPPCAPPRAAGYVNAGTCRVPARRRRPLLLPGDEHAPAGRAPRHRVVTGLDLVQRSSRIAAGEPLPFTQEDSSRAATPSRCALYAEDPANGYLPSTGTVARLRRAARARACGSTPASPPATRSPSTTTRCSPS